jgi:hypothetical protein
MPVVAGEVDGTSEDIEHATIDGSSPQPTESPVHTFGILAAQIAHAHVPELDEILGHARSDARNSAQVVH